MKLRTSNTNTEQSEDSLIIFCANYKKDKLEKIRRKYKNQSCLKCIKKTILRNKKTHSTPVVPKPEIAEPRVSDQNLFYTSLSPISQGHNTQQRIRREDIVRRNLFEKSLQTIIEEARKELLIEKLSRSLNTDYVNMNANNNSRVTKNNNSQEDQADDEVYDHADDEVYEEIMFNKQEDHFYEPVNFNIYEPINNFK